MGLLKGLKRNRLRNVPAIPLEHWLSSSCMPEDDSVPYLDTPIFKDNDIKWIYGFDKNNRGVFYTNCDVCGTKLGFADYSKFEEYTRFANHDSEYGVCIPSNLCFECAKVLFDISYNN